MISYKTLSTIENYRADLGGRPFLQEACSPLRQKIGDRRGYIMERIRAFLIRALARCHAAGVVRVTTF
jgi:hypothetical protein